MQLSSFWNCSACCCWFPLPPSFRDTSREKQLLFSILFAYVWEQVRVKTVQFRLAEITGTGITLLGKENQMPLAQTVCYIIHLIYILYKWYQPDTFVLKKKQQFSTRDSSLMDIRSKAFGYIELCLLRTNSSWVARGIQQQTGAGSSL